LDRLFAAKQLPYWGWGNSTSAVVICAIPGRDRGLADVVDSAVFQKYLDYPGESAGGYHVVVDDERVGTVRWDHIEPLQW